MKRLALLAYLTLFVYVQVAPSPGQGIDPGLGHLALYAGLVFLLAWTGLRDEVAVVVAGFAGMCLEAVQGGVGRTMDGIDLVLDVVGACLGLIVWRLWRFRRGAS